jgi:thiol-disulfide isomerase/thioredoxin
MIILHINPKNNDNNKLINQLNKYIKDGKKVFILFYMEGCGPCGMTRPEWAKIENVLKNKYSNDIVIADVDHRLIHLLKNVGNDPTGFPTMRYIDNKQKIIEDYEDSDNVSNKDRKIDSFVEWIQSKNRTNYKKGGSKTRKNRMNSNKQKGGVMINANDRDAFEDFIKNSIITFFGRGSYGVTFVAELKPGATSNYTFIDAEHFGEPVTKLLVKFSFLYDETKDEEPGDILLNPTKKVHNQMRFRSASIESFKQEVNIQTDIFLKTMNFLQPVCPAIVYANNYNNKPVKTNNNMNLTNLFDIMIQNSSGDMFTNVLLEEIKDCFLVYDDFSNLGVIAMEFANGYERMDNIGSNVGANAKQYQVFAIMCYYLLIQLALETGYTHADFHRGNILLNPYCDTYFKGLSGCPLLVDYGFAQKLPQDIYQKIKDYNNQKRYTDILKLLCDIPRTDNYDLKRSIINYSWVCGNYDPTSNQYVKKITGKYPDYMNGKIDKLFKYREESIDTIVAKFDEKHKMNPNLYPLLPLSNAVKNKMYAGMIEPDNNGDTNSDVSEENESIKQDKPDYDNLSNLGNLSLMDNVNSFDTISLTERTPVYPLDERQAKKAKIGGKWSRKYKLSINCKRPKGFSQKQYCKYGRNKTKRK